MRTFAFLILPYLSLGALTYQTRSGDESLDFKFDIPPGWESLTGKRKGSTYAAFYKPGSLGKVGIEVYAYRAENANLDRMLLQQRARLAVSFDRIYLNNTKGAFSREDVRQHTWTAFSGKTEYKLVTSFLRSGDKILKIFCMAPARRFRDYESAFDNALLSFAFADGKIENFDPNEPPAQKPVPPLPVAPPPKQEKPPEKKPEKKVEKLPPKENPAATKSLIVAVKSHDIAGAQKALDNHANINAQDDQGRTPLSYALEAEDEAMVTFLREHGALDVAAGRRMLIAIAENNLTKFYGTLEEAPDPNYADKNGNTPLIVASAYGNAEITQILIERGARIDAQDRDGYSAIFYAAQEGYTRTLEKLIAAKADVNLTNRFGFTALHAAVLRGKFKATRMLLEAGAVPDAAGPGVGTAAYWAALGGHKDIVALLVAAGAADPQRLSDIAEAARTNNPARVKAALEGPPLKLDMPDVFDNTPLLYAAGNGATEVAALLIEAGADVNHRNAEGNSALSFAVQRGDEKLVELLLAKKSDIKPRDNYGRTAIMIAAWKGHHGIVKKLHAAGSDTNLQDKEGWTALMFAAHIKDEDMVKLLLNAGAKTRIKNNAGQTAADIAKAQGSPVVAQAIQKGR